MRIKITWILFASMLFGGGSCQVKAKEKTSYDPVTLQTLPSVEFINQAQRLLALTGGLNQFYSFKEPTPINNQPVIRMNRDTLYMTGVFDVSAGVKITIPDMEDRYVSLMTVNEQGYTTFVKTGAGQYELNSENVGSDYAAFIVRILVNASSKKDISQVQNLQKLISDNVKANAKTLYQPAKYDSESYKKLYDKMLEKGRTLPSLKGAFGRPDEVNPAVFPIGTIMGWGALPDKNAFYGNVDPKLPVDTYQINVKDVPVNAFWSISLYDADGYFKENKLGKYNVNSVMGRPNLDGSYTIHFGGCEDNRVNCLPIMEGWNYIVRMYQPSQDIIDGTWMFPKPVKISK